MYSEIFRNLLKLRVTVDCRQRYFQSRFGKRCQTFWLPGIFLLPLTSGLFLIVILYYRYFWVQFPTASAVPSVGYQEIPYTEIVME